LVKGKGEVNCDAPGGTPHHFTTPQGVLLSMDWRSTGALRREDVLSDGENQLRRDLEVFTGVTRLEDESYLPQSHLFTCAKVNPFAHSQKAPEPSTAN